MWHTTLLNHVEGKLKIVCAVIMLLVITNDTDVAIMRYVLTAPQSNTSLFAFSTACLSLISRNTADHSSFILLARHKNVFYSSSNLSLADFQEQNVTTVSSNR